MINLPLLPLVAEAVPHATPDQISSWLIAGTAVLSMVALGKSLFVRKPPIEAEFVSRTEFKEFKTEVKDDLQSVTASMATGFQRISDKMDEGKTEMPLAGERRSGEIHEKLNDVAKKVAALDERTKKD